MLTLSDNNFFDRRSDSPVDSTFTRVYRSRLASFLSVVRALKMNSQPVTTLIKRFFASASNPIRARKYVLGKQFQGEPKRSDFDLVEEELPALEEGEFLTKAEYLSVDPYMRAYMIRYPVGTDMIGSQVARIIDSKNEDFPIGKLVVANYGWRDHTIDGGKKFDKPSLTKPAYILPDLGDLPPSLGLGVLGMPGNTAYFGLLELCQPKEGETVVVTGAAGAVGSHVGQIAKLKGCNVIGFAGSDAKCEWLVKEIGFDHAFNYKTVNPRKALREAAPNKVDCYFDNVGGELSSVILNQMNRFGRIAVCGSISSYSDDPSQLPKVAILQPTIVFNELKMEGFIVNRWIPRWGEGIIQNLKWIQQGKLKYRETVTNGFDNMYQAFIGMLRGENTGKAIVKV